MSRRPDGERDEMVGRLHDLLAEPRTMKQLVAWLDVDRRTVHRYIDDLQAAGCQIVRAVGRPTKYQRLE